MASSSSVHFLYILRCADGALYIGETADLERRLYQHNQGTASRRPIMLAYSETYPDRAAAQQRERQLKARPE